MTAPLEDRRLEAAAQMLNAWDNQGTGHIAPCRAAVHSCHEDALAMLATAIRETHAEELAEALQESIEGCNGFSHEELMRRVRLGFLDHSAVQRIMKARAILAAYWEIANVG